MDLVITEFCEKYVDMEIIIHNSEIVKKTTQISFENFLFSAGLGEKNIFPFAIL